MSRLIDKEVQELPRPSAPALSLSYAPLIKHIQTVTLHCQDAGDGLTSHFNHWSASYPEAEVKNCAGVAPTATQILTNAYRVMHSFLCDTKDIFMKTTNYTHSCIAFPHYIAPSEI